MQDKEKQYFIDGLQLASKDFFVDAIQKFNLFRGEFPDSDLADDALYNVGLCYFKMKQFRLAIETFNQAIITYPNATISPIENGQEFGNTAAKCYLGIFNCYYILNDNKGAEETIDNLKLYDINSYVLIDEKKKTFKEVALEILKIQ